MKSTNKYIITLSVIALLLSLLLLVASCDGAGNAGGGSESTAPTAEATGTDGATDRTEAGETDPAQPGDTDPVDGTDGADETGNAVTSAPAGGETTGSPETGKPSDSTGGETTKAPETTAKPSGTETSAPATPVAYTVTVVDANGDPVKNIIVTILGKDKVTDKNGVATYQLEPGDYTFTLKAISSDKEYTYDTAKCVFTASSRSVTVVFAEKLDQTLNTETIFAGDKEYQAAIVGEGSVQVNLTMNDMTYFLFSPTRSGIFRFSATSSKGKVDIGYYGGVHFVQSNNVADMVGDYFEVSVRTSSIGVTLVIGLKMPNGSAAQATLKIERVGNVPLDASDAPWIAIEADAKYLKKYNGDVTGKTLKDVNITDKNTKIVYNEKDGYYHFGDENGPVVMIRISTESPYIASFVDICSTSALGVYYYTDGKFDRKEQYNDMIAAYAEVTDGQGVVPLNDQLIDMVQKVGAYKGWWDETSAQYIFNTDAAGKPIREVESIAWMFACCYYE